MAIAASPTSWMTFDLIIVSPRVCRIAMPFPANPRIRLPVTIARSIAPVSRPGSRTMPSAGMRAAAAPTSSSSRMRSPSTPPRIAAPESCITLPSIVTVAFGNDAPVTVTPAWLAREQQVARDPHLAVVERRAVEPDALPAAEQHRVGHAQVRGEQVPAPRGARPRPVPRPACSRGSSSPGRGPTGRPRPRSHRPRRPPPPRDGRARGRCNGSR